HETAPFLAPDRPVTVRRRGGTVLPRIPLGTGGRIPERRHEGHSATLDGGHGPDVFRPASGGAGQSWFRYSAAVRGDLSCLAGGAGTTAFPAEPARLAWCRFPSGDAVAGAASGGAGAGAVRDRPGDWRRTGCFARHSAGPAAGAVLSGGAAGPHDPRPRRR